MVPRLTAAGTATGHGAADGAADVGFCERLAERVASECFGVSGGGAEVRVEPATMNYFSVMFGMEVPGRTGGRVVVKIPKDDLRRARRPRILPITATDRRLAEEEYRSLCCLSTDWNSPDLEVGFIRALAFLPDYNAIVTERVDAVEAYAVFRRWDLKGKVGGRQAATRLRHVLSRLGGALGRFHLGSIRTGDVQGSRELAKIEQYCKGLAARGTERDFLQVLRRDLRLLGEYRTPVCLTRTLKGLDVRNILIGEGDRLHLLDPGKMKENCPEADLARFLVTWRILYWGSPWFALGLRPSDAYEAVFLAAYGREVRRSSALLAVLLVKELLKHWATAHDSLDLKSWPRPVKRTVAAIYIDPFYKRQLSRESANALRGLRDPDTVRLPH